MEMELGLKEEGGGGGVLVAQLGIFSENSSEAN